MRPIIVTAFIATLTIAGPTFAADYKCGTRTDETAKERDDAVKERAAVVAKRFPDRTAKPDSSIDSGFVEPNAKLFLVSADDAQHCALTKDGRCKWGVAEPYTYQVRGTHDLINIPPGFTTDLASIPSVVWPLLPPDGPWVKAAVVHDFLYKTCGRGVWQHDAYAFTRKDCDPKSDKPCYTRDEADIILRQAMEDRGVSPFKRFLIFTAVHLFGGGSWGT